ncbi:tyrosine-type recombinase/integrase [Sulfurospirillum diekertiae]|uniref:Tyrosine-type recombinase/integrase n=1 Tax=Sulfurospirillum diekertiae TaxID=1854492 RepID=A0A6G9VQY5_9BACT|nr:tyrosine-type recombinase/integrase [Sulfurospirillum diekertiae]QIR75364.1 tyrosine-type recombinase/integrase [Sulfurospirillum diekertiae]QIR78013.1 tyrosine-type recombinase/integrase [Sulfurospirillum diekertiae]
MKRKKTLNMMSEEDFLFTFQHGDYKFVFEYDTPDEFREYLSELKDTVKELEAEKSYKRVQQIFKKEEQIEGEIKKGERPANKENFTFYDLETKFIVGKKKLEKVSASTYKAYEATFTKLKDFFKYERIENLNIEDFERFRDYLSTQVVNKTVNNHMAYVKMFVKWGNDRKLYPENNVQGVENLADSSPEIPHVNYTDKEIRNILEFEEFEQCYKDTFLIATRTGMRVNEICNIKNDDIKQDEETNIYYFDIKKSKTNAGVRQVPIHKDILERVLEIDFPLFPEKTDNASQKAILRQLYRVVKQGEGKFFHTFRGTFMNRCLKNYPRDLPIIQEIVGHEKEDKIKLSVDTYAKGYQLSLKKEILDSVSYY